MRKVLPLLLLSVVLAPVAARADGSVAITGRAGVAKPWGDFAQGAPMSDRLDWAFPLQADLQFRFTKSLQVGVYGRYSPTAVADRAKTLCNAATPKTSCDATDIGFGGVVEYRFSGRMEGGGWLGASFGYELFKFDQPLNGVNRDLTASGFEGGVQAGIDFELGGLTLGPYVQVGAGQFTKVKSEGGGQSSTSSISDKRLHGWAGLGIRFTILL